MFAWISFRSLIPRRFGKSILDLVLWVTCICSIIAHVTLHDSQILYFTIPPLLILQYNLDERKYGKSCYFPIDGLRGKYFVIPPADSTIWRVLAGGITSRRQWFLWYSKTNTDLGLNWYDGIPHLGVLYCTRLVPREAELTSMWYSAVPVQTTGTGTPIGDPVEAASIGHVVGAARKAAGMSPCVVGSVKSNIAHAESAAGLASIIKVLLMMKAGKIVPSLFSETLNPKIDFKQLHLLIPPECLAWNSTTKLAGANAFGYGGTNCNVILKSYSADQLHRNHGSAREKEVVALSAPRKELLHGLAQCCKLKMQEQNSPHGIRDISYTTTVRHQAYKYRVAYVVSSTQDLIAQLSNRPEAEKTPLAEKPKIIFIFNGMGTFWAGMCRKLIGSEPVAKQKLQSIDQLLQKYVSWSLIDILVNGEDVKDTAIMQPVIFACQVALASLWLHWGIHPDVILGHSLGEVAAAHVSGVLPLEEAVRVIVHRGRLLAEVSGGRMLAVGNYKVTEVKRMLQRYGGKVEIAAQNSSKSCTLSGDANCIDHIGNTLQSSAQQNQIDIFLYKMNVSTAFHSYQVEPILEELNESLGEIHGDPPKYKLISTVTGAEGTLDDFVTSKYWMSNARQTVLFDTALHKAIPSDVPSVLIEIGPKPVLRHNIKEITSEMNVQSEYIPSMSMGQEVECLQRGLCELFKGGNDISWDKYHSSNTFNLMTDIYLPFEPRKLYFISDVWQWYKNNNTRAVGGHAFVSKLDPENGQYLMSIAPNTTPFVYQHHMGEQIVLPGATHVEAALASVMMMPTAAAPLSQLRANVYIKQKVVIPPGQNVQLSLLVHRDNKGQYDVEVTHKGTMCAQAYIITRRSYTTKPVDLFNIKASCGLKMTQEEIYTRLKNAFFIYGPLLTMISECSFISENECLVTIDVPLEIMQQAKETHFHPAVVDAMLQSTIMLMKEESETMMPVSLEGLQVTGHVEQRMYIYVRSLRQDITETVLTAFVYNAAGGMMLSCDQIRLASVAREMSKQNLLYQIAWTEDIGMFDRKLREDSSFVLFGDDKMVNMLYHLLLPHSVIAVTESWQDMEQCVSTICTSVKSSTTVIGLFGFTKTALNAMVNDVYENVMKKCNFLRHLIATLYERNIDVPVYIVTLGGQFNMYKDGHGLVDATLAPLWGFVRSVLWEMVYDSLRLVDLESERTQALQKLAQLVLHRNLLPTPEFAISSEGRLFVNHIKRSNDFIQSPSTKIGQYDVYSQASLHLQVSTSTPILLHQHTAPTRCNGPSQIKLSVKRAAISHDLYYPSPDLTGIHSNPFMVLNAVSTNDGREIASLFPMKCQSVVYVPRQCTIDTHSLPCGSPLLLAEIYLAYNVFTKVCSSKFKTIHSYITDHTPLFKRVFGMLSVCFPRIRVNHLESLEDFSKCANNENDDVILVASSTPKQLKFKVPVILIPELCGLDYRACLEYCDSVYTISTSVVFSPVNIKDQIVPFFNWLKRQRNLLKLSMMETPIQFDTEMVRSCSTSILVMDFQASALQKVPLHLTLSSLFRKHGIYLLVGGLTGLGWELLQYMAHKGAGNLVCISRSPPSEGKMLAMCNLQEETQSVVTWAQCDIGEFEQASVILQKIRQRMNGIPVRGVFHSAVVYADAYLIKMEPDELERSLMPKVKGAWNLHKLTLEDNLDYFVMHSSMTSILGFIGQTNYAAANQFLDALAFFRRFHNLPAQTINWGALNVGLLQRADWAKEFLVSYGYEPMDVDTILSCFEHALLENKTQYIFLEMDWDVMSRWLETNMKSLDIMLRTRLSGLLEPKVPHRNSREAVDTEIMETIKGIPVEDQLLHATKVAVGKVIGVPASEIDVDTPLFNFGMNSMYGMILRSQLKSLLHINIPLNKIADPQTTVRVLVTEANKELSQKHTNSLKPSTSENHAAGYENTDVPTNTQLTGTRSEENDKEIGTSLFNDLKNTFSKKGRYNSHRVDLKLAAEQTGYQLIASSVTKATAINLEDVDDVTIQTHASRHAMVMSCEGRSTTYQHQDLAIIQKWVNALRKAIRLSKLMGQFIWADTTLNPTDNTKSKKGLKKRETTVSMPGLNTLSDELCSETLVTRL